MDGDEGEVYKNAKRMKLISSHLDLTSLGNKKFIIGPKKRTFIARPMRQFLRGEDGPCSGCQSESRIRFILPVCGFRHTINVDINTICSDVTKNSEITKCTENVGFFFHGSWKDEMGIGSLRISLQAKGSSAGATKIEDFVCKLI